MGDLPEGTVTILITDVVGSPALHTTRGDKAARRILEKHEELVRQQVADHGGHEIKSMGDGFIVAFVSARRSVGCAVAIQRACGEAGTQDDQKHTEIGAHSLGGAERRPAVSEKLG